MSPRRRQSNIPLDRNSTPTVLGRLIWEVRPGDRCRNTLASLLVDFSIISLLSEDQARKSVFVKGTRKSAQIYLDLCQSTYCTI